MSSTQQALPIAMSRGGSPASIHLDFIWTTPNSEDEYCDLRPLIEVEADHCPGITVRFYSAAQYQDSLTRRQYQHRPDARPDGVVLFGSIRTMESDLYQMVRQVRQEVGCPVAAWVPNDPYEFDVNLRLAELVDWLFTNDRNTALYYGRNNVSWLPLAAAEIPHILPESEYLPEDKAEWDFCFCGAAFTNRRELITGLYPVLRKYRTLIVGHLGEELGWPAQKLPGLSFQEALPYKNVLDVYRQSRIVLNLSRNHDICNTLFQILPSTPASRTYEVAAMGIPQFVFLDRVEMFHDFAADEMATFASLAEFERMAERYIGSYALRRELGERARAKARAQHLYRHRLTALAHTFLSRADTPPSAARAELQYRAARRSGK